MKLQQLIRQAGLPALLATTVAAAGLFCGATSAQAQSIDVTNNMIILTAPDDGTQQADVSMCQNAVNSAYDGGMWDGPGITSSYAAADVNYEQMVNVLVFDNLNAYLPSLFNQDLDQSTFDQVIVAAAYTGDLDGNGLVDGNDYFLMGIFYSIQLACADFDHNGVVDGNDYFIMGVAYSVQGDYNLATLTPAGATSWSGVSSSAAPASAPAAVPEPGVVGSLAAGLIALMSSRRKSRI